MSASYQLWSPQQRKEKVAEVDPPPPPKPPRGRFRQPHPLTDSTNVDDFEAVRTCSPDPSSKFVPCSRSVPPSPQLYSATDIRSQMIEEFTGIVGKESPFSGRDGLQAMTSIVQVRSKLPHCENSAETALKMLDHWLVEKIFRRIDCEASWIDTYVEDKSAMYMMNPPEMHRVAIMNNQRSRSVSRERGVFRKGSFKNLLFRPKIQKHSTSGESDMEIETDIQRNAAPVPREFSISRVASPAPSISISLATDDADVFEASLKVLLREVEVPVLDDVLSANFTSKESTVSFLASLIKRFVFNAEADVQEARHTMTNVESVLMNFGLKAHSERLRRWFASGSACAKNLVLALEDGISPQTQVHRWARTTLAAVCETLSNSSDNGQHPLIPTEFSTFLIAILNELHGDEKKKQKRDLALKCLWWMIPSKIRSQLANTINFIAATYGTDECFSFNDPFFVPKSAPGMGENYQIVVHELKNYLVSKTALREAQQRTVIKMLFTLMHNGELERIPVQVEREVEAQKRDHKTAVTFCSSGVTDCSNAIEMQHVELMRGILESNKFSYDRKREMIRNYKVTYPDIMAKHFPML